MENISNNVQQLLLSEALVANKKGSKRSSGGSNSSVGSGASSKKGEEYKSPPYPDSGSNVSGGPMQDPYSTPQHQPLPMELHEGGYSSSSDEPLDRGYYYFGQGRSPAQAHNNTQLGLDTASSCSMASPDDMSTRSGDSGLHNLTPDHNRCQTGQRGDGMNTPVKSIGDERSPTSMTILSPMKQERDSPSNIQHISDTVKENFEESAWTEKSVEKEGIPTENKHDWERDLDITKSTEKLGKWSDEEKCPAVYSKVSEDITQKSYCYEDAMYQEVQSKYDPNARDSAEQSPAALCDPSNKDHFSQEMKSDGFKSESPTASESSVKTLPFASRGDLDQDQYCIEKEDSSDYTSPAPEDEVLENPISGKSESKESEDKENEEEEDEERRKDNANEEEQEEIQKKQKSSVSLLLSGEDLEEGKKVSQSSTEEHTNKNPSGDLYCRTEGQSSEPNNDCELTRTPAHPNLAAATAAIDACERESAIGDIAPQSAMPVFSALTEKAAPPVQSRDHIDHSDAKVLEPDSPQLPGKSILPSAPSWANTPPSPKKGDEDIEPGISCASAVTPLAKPEPVAPSAQPRAFGRKHTRGRRRIVHSGVGIRQQLSLEREGRKEEEGANSPSHKTAMPPSKTVLFSDQTDLAHQEPIVSQTPKMLMDGFRSRMCTRSFNATDLTPKVEPHVKRKPGPKPNSKPGPKPGPKPGSKPGSKSAVKPGSKPSIKSGPKPGQKSGTKTGQKPLSCDPELPMKIETTIKRKPGPKPGSKSGPKSGSKPGPKSSAKPGPKPGPKPASKAAEDLSSTDNAAMKATVGRPKATISKVKVMEEEDIIQPITGLQSRGRKSIKATIPQANRDLKPTQEQKLAQPEAKASEKESKNMVLRSRKPSKENLLKDKKKIIGEDIQNQELTEIKVNDISPKVEELLSVEQIPPRNPDAAKTTEVPEESSAPPVPHDQSEKKTSPPLKRKPSPEPSTVPVKRKRGPKPKPKTSSPQPNIVKQAVPALKERSVRGHRRKRGPPKKTSVDTSIAKHAPPNTSGPDIVTDVPAVPPQCPTKTKVLPPRKGRGQKYEAMVQKITSPSSKKHIPAPQLDSNLTEDVTTKSLSEPALKDAETSVQINNTELVESRKEVVKQLEGAVRKEGMIQEKEKHEVTQEGSTSEAGRHSVEDEVVNLSETRQENLKSDTQQDVVDDKTWNSSETPLEVGAPGEWTQQALESVTVTATKSTRTKRKRWAMVESTDASVVALEAGSLIVTTPRLAKQRAIKNNHEMHLKQRRKKRKDQAPLDETDIIEEADTEVNKQQEREEEKGTTPESTVSLPISQDEIIESTHDVSADLIHKPRRGRKPSANSTKRKTSKALSEQSPGNPVRIHKKPGPKPGMKDAIEVIEAVVRAAGCEQDKKEEREKEERERTERGNTEKEDMCIVGPVVTVTEKQTEVISVKRIRRKPFLQNSKLSFCPYVRINNSRDFSSWCAIVNKPEDAVVFQRRRKKGILRMRNPFTVAKVVPHAVAMLQGPMVNKNIIGRCLTCCLCGKPANYKNLGDLCGPYYTEDSVPRKVLTVTHTRSFRDESDKNDGGATEEAGTSSKEGGEVSSEKEGNTEPSSQEASSSKHHHWHYRRAERPERLCREGGPRRLTLRERFRRMKQLQTTTGVINTGLSRDQESSDSVFRRLQVEAEAKEHWAHENCAIWTKGVIMVAGRLYGLKEAACNSAQTVCWHLNHSEMCLEENRNATYSHLQTALNL